MVDIITLKKSDKFYLVDLGYYTCDSDAVTECIVIKRYLKTKKYILIDALRYVDCTPPQIVVDNGDGFYKKLPKEAEQHMYLNLEDALNHYKEYRRLYELGMNACNGDSDMDWYELGKEIDKKYKDYPSCFGDEDKLDDEEDDECDMCKYKDKCEEKINAYYESIGSEVLSQIDGID